MGNRPGEHLSERQSAELRVLTRERFQGWALQPKQGREMKIQMNDGWWKVGLVDQELSEAAELE